MPKLAVVVVIDSTDIYIVKYKRRGRYQERVYAIRNISFLNLNRIEKILESSKYRQSCEFEDGEVKGRWYEWEKS